MTKKERVSAAIAHKKPDRIPRGELAIESGLRDKLRAGKDLSGIPSSSARGRAMFVSTAQK